MPKMTPEEAEQALAGYATTLDGRDDLVLAAISAGLSKHRIYILSGIARTTIDKIIGKEPPMTMKASQTAAGLAEQAYAIVANLGYRVKGGGSADLTSASLRPADVYVWASHGEVYVEAAKGDMDMDAIRAALAAAGIAFTVRRGTGETSS